MNCLKINPKKTKVLLCATKGKTLTKQNSLFLESEQLEMLDSPNIRGAHLSKHLTFNEMVVYLQLKLSATTGVIARLRHILPTEVMVMLYNVFVVSLMQ